MRVFLLFIIFTVHAEAADLVAPHDLQHTSVLPSNVRSPRLKLLFSPITDRYNQEGRRLPLGADFNVAVGWNEITRSRSGMEKILLEGSIKALNFKDDSVAGHVQGEANIHMKVQAPMLSWGLTDNFTMVLAVPIYHIDVSIDTGFLMSEDGRSWLGTLLPSFQESVQQLLSDPVNVQAKSSNLEKVESYKTTSIGDISLIGRWQFYKDEKNTLLLSPSVVLPTGESPNSDRIVDISSGDGQTDISLLFSWDRILRRNIRWNLHAGYTLQLSDKLERRIPRFENDRFSPDSESVHRDLGDQVGIGTSVYIGNENKNISVGAGYSYQYMFETQFKGDKYASERYGYLNAMKQEIHAATFQLKYSTVDYYKNKTFSFPFIVTMTYSHPLSGKNVVAAPIVGAELIMFF